MPLTIKFSDEELQRLNIRTAEEAIAALEGRSPEQFRAAKAEAKTVQPLVDLWRETCRCYDLKIETLEKRLSALEAKQDRPFNRTERLSIR